MDEFRRIQYLIQQTIIERPSLDCKHVFLKDEV